LIGAAGLWFLLAGQICKFYAAIFDLWSILVWNVAGMTGYEGMTKTWDLIQVTTQYFLSEFILGYGKAEKDPSRSIAMEKIFFTSGDCIDITFVYLITNW
jgi:hypothetical protein